MLAAELKNNGLHFCLSYKLHFEQAGDVHFLSGRAAILRFCGVTGYISRLPSYNFLIIEELQVTYFDFQVTSYSFVMKSYDFFRPLGGYTGTPKWLF